MNYPTFTQALKDAERMKQQHLYRFENHNYMIIQKDAEYIVEPLNYAKRDEAIKNNALLLVL
jgi:hypothetical protein